MSGRWIVLAMATAGVLAAQDPPGSVGRLSYITGSVSFQPSGVNDWVPATVNRPLTVGDQLYADAGARAEIHVPGAAFRIGSQSAFEFMNLDDRNVQVRLSEGSLNVRVRRLDRDQSLEVDTPNLAFSIDRPGEYRIDTNPDTNQTYVTVRSGEAQVTGNVGSFAVHAREQAVVAGQDQQAQYNVYAAPGNDDFDNWSLTRDQREDRFHSSRYVSPNVVGYEDLDEYGSWRSEPRYGEYWVPRGVPSGWAPYHDGHWAWVDPWGWTWVDDAPWGFAPFHYGRWAHFGDTWGWVPGPVAVMPVYAPALVAWVGFGGGAGVSFGFGGGSTVGWFPLGPRDVYVPAYRASETYVTRINTSNTTVINNTNITNVYNTYVKTGSVPTANYANRTVAGAVVAVPQAALTSSRPVQQVGVKVRPAQITAMKAGTAAPHVAPQVTSVLGHPQSGGAPRPPAAVVSRPVVAKSTPPPLPPSFQQRQNLMAQNPGRPLPIQQVRQMSATPAATARPVHVVAQARPVTPHVSNAPAPRPAPAAQATRQPATLPEPANRPAIASRPQTTQPQPNRPFEPPSAQQHQAQPVTQNRPAVASRPQNTQPRPNRPFESPSAPQHQAQPVTPNRPAVASRPQNTQPQQNRPVGPAVQEHPVPASRSPIPQRPQNNQPQQNRSVVAPPAVQQHPAQPAPASRPPIAPQPPRPVNPPPQAQRRVEPQPSSEGRNRSAPPPSARPSAPAPQEQRKAAPPAPAQERKAPPPPAHPTDEKKRKDERQ